MRWDRLFDDLEGQLEQELGADEIDLIAEEERLRLGRLALRDRIAAMARAVDGREQELDLVLRDGTSQIVAVGSVGRDWVAGRIVGGTRVRASCVIPIPAIAAVSPTAGQLAAGLGADPVGQPGASLQVRLGISFVLRDLCRRRSPVDIGTAWSGMHGTIDRVGRDHLDLAEHDPGVPRRGGAVRRTRLLPFSELVVLRF